MEQSMVPQVQAANPVANPDAAALALTGNNATDLANIAKEMGVQLDAQGNVVESAPTPAQVPAQQPQAQPVAAAQGRPPEVEQPATQAEVPPKFQNPDGSVNVEKLVKSTENLDSMIAKYRAKEREGQQLQNRINNPPQQAQAVPQAQGGPAGLTPLEIQVAQDILNKTAELQAQGYQPAQAQAIATASVQVRLQEARYAAEQNDTSDLRRRVEDNERSRELQGLIQSDPQLMSPGMVDALWQIRQENPWINKAPEPWKAAYIHLKGTQGHAPQVQTPTPTGQAAKAPPTPVGPVTRVLPSLDLTDPRQLAAASTEALEAEAKRLYPNIRFGPRY